MNKLAIVFLAAIAAAGVAPAQIKVANINSQKALLDTEEIKKAQKDMEGRFKPRQDQMAKLEKDLQDIQTQLQSGKLNQESSIRSRSRSASPIRKPSMACSRLPRRRTWE